MNAIKCELCGSNDVVKQGDYFVCQHCGTKYTLEDARKLIGTVKIDNSDTIKSYLQYARRAKEKEDWEESEKYYNLVEQNEPNNVEAIFYSAYAKAMASLTSDDLYKRQAIFKSLSNSIQLIDDNYNPDEESQYHSILIQISDDIFRLCSSNFVYTKTTHRYFNGTTTEFTHTDNTDETYTLFHYLNFNFAANLSSIAEKTNGKSEAQLDYLYERAIMHLQYIINQKNDWSEFSMVSAGLIDDTHKKWNQYNPNHSIPASLVGKMENEKNEYHQKIQLAKEQQEAKTNEGCAITIIFIVMFIILFVVYMVKYG